MKLETFFEHFDLLAEAPSGVKKLRELILDLAVRSKLVPQDANDEPAAVLLERIKKEKERLVKEGKIKKEKILPAIKDNEIFYQLPNNWTWVRFIDITSVITCGIASTPKYTTSGKIFLSAKNIKPYRFMPDEHKFVSVEDYLKIIQGGKPELNDILLTRVGAGIGEAAIIDQDLEFAYYVSLTLIKPFHNYICSKYILNWLNSPEGVTKALENTYGKGVSQGNLNVNQVRQFNIPLPPLNEQKRIVSKVDELMKLCDELEARQKKKRETRILINNAALNKLLTADTPETFTKNWQHIGDNFDILYSAPENIGKLRQAILQLAVMGKLVPQDANDEPAAVLLERIKKEKERLVKEGKIKKDNILSPIKDDEIPYDLPKGWEWEMLGNLTKFIDYRGKTPQKTNSGVKLITAKNVRMGYIKDDPKEYISEETYHQWMTRGFPRYGDLLFTTEAPLGNIAQLLTTEKIALAQRVIDFQIFADLFSPYLKFALMSSIVQDFISNKATGMTAEGIKAAKLKLILVPIPPLNEQKRIVTKVDKLMKLCDELETKLTQTQIESEKIINAAVKQLLMV